MNLLSGLFRVSLVSLLNSGRRCHPLTVRWQRTLMDPSSPAPAPRKTPRPYSGWTEARKAPARTLCSRACGPLLRRSGTRGRTWMSVPRLAALSPSHQSGGLRDQFVNECGIGLSILCISSLCPRRVHYRYVTMCSQKSCIK